MKLEYTATVEVEETLVSKHLSLNSRAKDSIEEIIQYVEGFRVILWEHAFSTFFRKDAKILRSIPFSKNEGTQDAIKCLVYIYTCFPIF
jgi:hypothetical protein